MWKRKKYIYLPDISAVKVAKLRTELNFAKDKAAKIVELKKLGLTKELAIAEAEMKVIDKVEETQSEFSERCEDMLPDNINKDSCKDDLLRNYLASQASARQWVTFPPWRQI